MRITISCFMVNRGGEGLFEHIATIIQFPGCLVLFGGTAAFNRLWEIELQFPSAGNYCLFSVSVATETRLRSAKYQHAAKTTLSRKKNDQTLHLKAIFERRSIEMTRRHKETE